MTYSLQSYCGVEITEIVSFCVSCTVVTQRGEVPVFPATASVYAMVIEYGSHTSPCGVDLWQVADLSHYVWNPHYEEVKLSQVALSISLSLSLSL